MSIKKVLDRLKNKKSKYIVLVVGLAVAGIVGLTACSFGLPKITFLQDSKEEISDGSGSHIVEETYGDHSYQVYVPDGYDESRRYPSVYMMPYDGYNSSVYIEDGIQEKLDSIMDTENVTDMIVVFPDFEEGDNFNRLMTELISEVDKKYSTISEREFRAIMGANVGGYMAYENVLVDKTSDSFFAVGAHMGDFVGEENPWYSQDKSVYDAVLALDKLSDKGYSTLEKYYFYIDGPNKESATTSTGGTSSIGSALEKLSNPYWQYGDEYYLSATPDTGLVEFSVLDGKADSDYYLKELSRSFNRFSNKFTEVLVTGDFTCSPQAVAASDQQIKVLVSVETADEIELYTSQDPQVKISVEVEDDKGQMVYAEESILEGNEVAFEIETANLLESTKNTMKAYVSVFGMRRELSSLPLVKVQETGSLENNQLIDLMGNWYFNAYKAFKSQDTSIDELDKISNITEETYSGWELVQPALAWWDSDFAKSLNGQANYEGYAWYVREFDMPSEDDFPTEKLIFSAGKFDEANEVYINGKLVGSTGMDYEQVQGIGVYDESNPWDENCVYDLDSSLLNYGGKNTVAIRMCNSTGGGGWYEGPVGIYTETSYKATTGEASRILKKTYQSKATGNEESYSIYLPKTYEDNEEDEFPVLYLLHGINSTSNAFVIDGIEKYLDQAIEDGELGPIIVVMPDDPTKESFWYGKYANMITSDLVSSVDKAYRTKADSDNRYIAGCSMGGAGAVNIGLNNPELFSGIVSFYGAFEYVDGLETARAMTTDELSGFRIYMACGNQDMYNFYEAQEQMSNLLSEKGVEHYHLVDNGGHNSEFYLPHFIDSIKYVMK